MSIADITRTAEWAALKRHRQALAKTRIADLFKEDAQRFQHFSLQLDEFEIQAGEQGFGPTLSVGEQVGEHFFFRVKQGFGDAQATPSRVVRIGGMPATLGE